MLASTRRRSRRLDSLSVPSPWATIYWIRRTLLILHRGADAVVPGLALVKLVNRMAKGRVSRDISLAVATSCLSRCWGTALGLVVSRVVEKPQSSPRGCRIWSRVEQPESLPLPNGSSPYGSPARFVACVSLDDIPGTPATHPTGAGRFSPFSATSLSGPGSYPELLLSSRTDPIRKIPGLLPNGSRRRIVEEIFGDVHLLLASSSRRFVCCRRPRSSPTALLRVLCGLP